MLQLREFEDAREVLAKPSRRYPRADSGGLPVLSPEAGMEEAVRRLLES
jgi:hypothetical protein